MGISNSSYTRATPVVEEEQQKSCAPLDKGSWPFVASESI